jgi:hypothetical protein
MRTLFILGIFLSVSDNVYIDKSVKDITVVAPTITLEKNGKIETHFRPPYRIKKGARIA